MRGKAAAGKQSDRWHNSGGSKAARDLPSGDAKIRRRYGSISQVDGQKYRYHEYKLVFPTAAGPGDLQAHQRNKFQQQVVYQEDKSCVLYHVMLPLGEDPDEEDSDEEDSQSTDAREEESLTSATRAEQPSIDGHLRSAAEHASAAEASAVSGNQNQPAQQPVQPQPQPQPQPQHQKSGDAQTTPQWSQRGVRNQPEPLQASDKTKVDEGPGGAGKPGKTSVL